MRYSITLTVFVGLLAIQAGLAPQSSEAQSYRRSRAQSYRPDTRQAIVPGTGTLIDYVGDTFEEPDWGFVHNMPKSSRELNERTYGPMAYSTNRRWAEGPERGQPDLLKIVATPQGGLPGSRQALQISTLRSGIPGVNTNDVQQDDLIMNITPRLGSTVRASELPSCVVRVYLPEPSLWEDRTGPHFGIRLGARTTQTKKREGFLAFGKETVNEPYWPGIWIHFKSETSRGVEQDSAFLKVRGNNRGNDYLVRDIPLEQFGWWTFGMSMTSDGRIHYFARPGVEDLEMSDHLASEYPYSFRAERLNSFFFNICNRNNGRTWSTPFVIDDPEMYVINDSRVNQIVDRKVKAQERRAQMAERRQQRSKKRRK